MLLLLELIRELAEYERAVDRVTGTAEMLHEALFGDEAVAEAVIAELEGAPAGFALYYRTFSTWLCLPGLWLEDLLVSPAYRKAGVGRALLSHLAELAVARGYGRIEWSALNWNQLAIDFYERLGAEALVEWQVFRLSDEPLRQLARERP